MCLQFVKCAAEREELIALFLVVLALLKRQREEVFDALNERLIHECLHLLV